MTLASYGRLIRCNRNFRLLWGAQIVSEIGDWFYSVAIFSFLLELTGSAQMVAFAFLMQVLPQTLMSPMAGVINDRVSRKKVMIFADWARAGIVLAMMLVRSRGTLWLLFVLLFLETLCWALFEPGHRAVIPNITSEEEVPIANAIASATWSVNFALGAGLGGIALVWLGRDAVFVINSLTFVASALMIGSMRFEEPHTDHDEGPLTVRDLFDFSPIVDGIRYVRKDPKLLATIFVKAGNGFAGSNWVILPVLGEKIFPVHLKGLSDSQAGTLGMSALLASRGVGAMIGAYGTGRFAGGDAPRLRWTILVGFSLTAIGYMCLGYAGSIVIAGLMLMVAHAGGSACWTASSTLLQKQTDDRFRGRVFSAEFAFATLVMSISSFTAGKLSDAGVEARTLAFITGVTMLLPLSIWLVSGRIWKVK